MSSPRITGGAEFSQCGKYRYALYRTWDVKAPKVMFVGLNPSTADAEVDDPTIRRCIRFAKDWGFGGLIMTNLFALRATNPKEMLKHTGPIGTENHTWFRVLLGRVSVVVACWGNRGDHQNQDEAIMSLIPHMQCLGLTGRGMPKHPLRLRADTSLRPLVYSEKVNTPGDVAYGGLLSVRQLVQSNFCGEYPRTLFTVAQQPGKIFYLIWNDGPTVHQVNELLRSSSEHKRKRFRFFNRHGRTNVDMTTMQNFKDDDPVFGMWDSGRYW